MLHLPTPTRQVGLAMPTSQRESGSLGVHGTVVELRLQGDSTRRVDHRDHHHHHHHQQQQQMKEKERQQQRRRRRRVTLVTPMVWRRE